MCCCKAAGGGRPRSSLTPPFCPTQTSAPVKENSLVLDGQKCVCVCMGVCMYVSVCPEHLICSPFIRPWGFSVCLFVFFTLVMKTHSYPVAHLWQLPVTVTGISISFHLALLMGSIAWQLGAQNLEPHSLRLNSALPARA